MQISKSPIISGYERSQCLLDTHVISLMFQRCMFNVWCFVALMSPCSEFNLSYVTYIFSSNCTFHVSQIRFNVVHVTCQIPHGYIFPVCDVICWMSHVYIFPVCDVICWMSHGYIFPVCDVICWMSHRYIFPVCDVICWMSHRCVFHVF